MQLKTGKEIMKIAGFNYSRVPENYSNTEVKNGAPFLRLLYGT
jgi:hypothetical protein